MADSKYKTAILDAIDQLRQRKARPDLERICHMLQRRHGLNSSIVQTELEKLIDADIVIKVDYKGNTSYRNAAKWTKGRNKEAALKSEAKTCLLSTKYCTLPYQQQQTTVLLKQRIRAGPGRPPRTAISSLKQAQSKRGRPPSKRKRIKKTHGPDFLETSSLPSSDSEDPRCDYCFLSASSNRNGMAEDLLFCKDCNAKAHPSCMEYSTELAERSKMGPWQCIDCKTCILCDDSKDGGSMLFCDSCDKGYHMNCHIPKISEQPKDSKNKITDISILGKWVCHQCSSDNKTEDADTDSSGVSSEQRNVIVRGRIGGVDNTTGLPTPCDSPVPGDIAQGDFGSTCVGTACNKTTELQYPDVIPDAKNWTVDDVEKFLTSVGFSEQAVIFKEQEIDGKSLLLMKRSDVLTGLTIKLGPALKIYNHIKRLQTGLPDGHTIK